MSEDEGSPGGLSDAQRAELDAIVERELKRRRGFLARMRDRAVAGVERARQFAVDATPRDPGPEEEWDEDKFEGWAGAMVQRHRVVFAIASLVLVAGVMSALFLPGLAGWFRVAALAVLLAAPPAVVGVLWLRRRDLP